jgi:hypothetical protein
MGEISDRVYRDRGSQLAKAMRLCRDNHPAYPSAAALLAVHSAIAYNDAVQIKLTGNRSRSQDHGQAIAAIRRACGTAKIEPRGAAHLGKLLSMKTDVSYGDKEVDKQLADTLCVAADRFEAWAEGYVLNRK